MKIVDNDEEQDLLETLLEGSKPAQPATTAALDYLLATPFRYNPLRGGSRFRGVTDSGVFYGAQSVHTASAFAKPKPQPSMQTWWLAVRSDAVIWRRDNDSMTFSSAAW